MKRASSAAARIRDRSARAEKGAAVDIEIIDALRDRALALGRFEAVCMAVALSASTAAAASGEARADALIVLDEAIAALKDTAKSAAPTERDALSLATIEALKEGQVDLSPFSAATRQADALRGAFDGDGAPSAKMLSDFSDFARERARAKSQKAMTAMLEKVDKLSKAALGDASEARSLIDQTLSEIEEISLSVRLISLNASVEAARAGAAGRGFGVIASEIQNLAVRAQSSVDSVRTQIKDLSL